MARTTHLHQRHRGLIPADQLASGTSSAGRVPVADGAGSQAWTAPAALTVKEEDGTPSVANVTEIRVTNGTLTSNGSGSVSVTTGGAGGGAGGWETVGAGGTKLEAGRTRIWDTAEDGSIVLDGSITLIGGTGFGIEMEVDPGEVVDISSGDGLLLPPLAADPTAVRDGQIFYDTALDVVRLRANGAWVTIGGGGLPSGTSNPGSPSDGDLFYRSDLSLIIRYHSAQTHWRCVCPHVLTFGEQQAHVPYAASTAARTAHPSLTLDIWAIDFWIASYVNTTNSGTQYWTVTLDNTSTVLSTISNAANALIIESAAVGASIATGGWITLSITKVSTPGTGYVPAHLSYRFIVP